MKPSRSRSSEMAGAYKRSKFLAEQVRARIRPRRVSGRHRQPHRAHGRSRFQAHPHRPDRPRFPGRQHARLHRHRPERRQRPRCRPGSSARLRTRQTWRTLYPRRGRYDPRPDPAELASITGRKAPSLKLPYFVAWAAGVVTTGSPRITGIPPRAPLEAVRMARKKDVGLARESRPRAWLLARPRQTGACRRRRMVLAGDALALHRRRAPRMRPLGRTLGERRAARAACPLGAPGTWQGRPSSPSRTAPDPHRAALAVQAAPAPQAICSIGFCGALDPPSPSATSSSQLKSATAPEATPPACPAARPAHSGAAHLAKPHRATAAEKRHLHSTGAQVVEMEAAARRSCVRAIERAFLLRPRRQRSCAARISPTILMQFLMPDGRFNVLRLVSDALSNPFTPLSLN